MAKQAPFTPNSATEHAPPPARLLALDEIRVGVAPEVLSTLSARASFVLALYDPFAKVGGITRLHAPSSLLANYVRVATRRLLAEMRGRGALKERIIGHVIAGEAVSATALRTVAGIIRAQGLGQVNRHAPNGSVATGNGHQLHLRLGDGHLEIENLPRPRPARDSSQIALELGTQILALHTFRQDVAASQPDPSVSLLLQEIAQIASRMLGGAQCFLALQEGDALILRAASHLPADAPQLAGSTPADPLARALLARGNAALVGNARRDPDIPLSARSSVVSILYAPLSEPGAQGLLYAVHPAADAFIQEDLGLLQLFAQQAAIAIKNARIYQKLQSKTADLEAILQGIGDGLLVVDPQMNVIMANSVAQELLGPDLKSGEPFPAHSPLIPLLQQARHEESSTQEINLPPHTGEAPTICQATLSGINSADGHHQGVVAVLRDITEQKELERLRAEAMSAVSHELRTPLHSISGFVDLILMGKTGGLTEVQRDFLTTVKQQATHLQHIINDLLEFSRLEYGQTRLTLEPVDLSALAESVLRKLALMAQENRVRLLKAFPEDLGTLPGDSVRLEQVLSNLVDNAIKFTPAEGMVTVGAEDSGDTLRLWVADTGIGIPLEEQERVFAKYYQVGQNGNMPRRGAGLGLAICKSIVEQHGGSIWVESTPNRGSTFYIELPKGPPQQDTQAHPTTSNQVTSWPGAFIPLFPPEAHSLLRQKSSIPD